MPAAACCPASRSPRAASTPAQTRETVTNEAGFYSAPFLPLGAYDVTATLAGFKTVVREAIDVSLNDTRVVDFELTPATVAETVIVRAEAPRINTTNGEIKGLAERPADRGSADAQPGQLPVAGGVVHRLSGESDQRAEQPDRVVRIVDQLQRHGHARRDVPDQRRQQRRLVGEPEPAGRRALDDQGVPGHHQHLLGGVRPRLRRGGAGADQVRHQPAARRALRVPSGQRAGTRESAFALTKPNNSRDQYGVAHGLSDPPQSRCSPSPASTRSGLAAFGTYTRDLFLASRAGRAAADPRQRHAGEPRLHRERAVTIPERDPERPAQPAHVPDGAAAQPAGRRRLRSARLDADGTHTRDGAVSVHAADLRVRRHHPGRSRAPEQPSAEHRHHLDAGARTEDGRRVSLRPRAAQHQRRHRGRQRHADRPLRPVAGVGDDPRQRGQFSDQSRSDRPSVRLQPDAAGRRPPQRQDRRRPPLPAARRLRRQLRARVLERQQQRLRRRHLFDVVRGVSRRLRRQLSEGVGAVLPREPHQRIQPVRRGQLADSLRT